jgi:hypothetical protein
MIHSGAQLAGLSVEYVGIMSMDRLVRQTGVFVIGCLRRLGNAKRLGIVHDGSVRTRVNGIVLSYSKHLNSSIDVMPSRRSLCDPLRCKCSTRNTAQCRCDPRCKRKKYKSAM